ncbi:MAG: ABC transporter permease [Chthoniobacterales bacterium]
MINDLRHAVRMLLKTPAFTVIAIFALALGIGLATTMFTSVSALLIRPLPHLQDQAQLIYVSQYSFQRPENNAVTLPDFRELKKAGTLEDLAAYTELTVIVSEAENPVRYLGAEISADAFAFLGVQPILGRLFRPEEGELSAEPVALLGYDIWQKQFGGESSIVGRGIPINGRLTTIVGVMPKGFRFPEVSDLWLPLQPDEKKHPRGDFSLDAIGKIKKGVSLEQARAELEAIGARLALEFPETNSGFGVRVVPWRGELVKHFKTLTLLVLGAVLFVHLIACANVANLLLARGATRAREIGVRIALGASRGQIVRQLLTESLILSVTGSALGLLFAVWGVDLMLSAVPTEIPAWIRFDFDWRIFSFAVGLGFISSVLIGLIPALQSSRPHLLEVLKEGGRGGGSGPRSQRLRSTLIVGEVALALILLVGAGLMVRSFMNLARTDIGADPSSTLTFRVGLPEAFFPEAKSATAFFERLIPKLTALPGVESAGATSSLPAGGMGLSALVLEGEAPPERLQEARIMSQIAITPGFLETARISLLRGRDLTAADNAEARALP